MSDEPEFPPELVERCVKRILQVDPEAQRLVDEAWMQNKADPAREALMEWVRLILRESGHAELVAALKEAITAIDDWLNIYASDQCDAARVQEAKDRVNEAGTLAYIAHVQQKNRDALRKAGEQ